MCNELTFFSAEGVFDHKAFSEKSLARMVKAKAKADRAAARLAAQSHNQSAAAAAAAVATPPPVSANEEASPAPTGNEGASNDAQETTDASTAPPATEAVQDRTEMLRSKPGVVGKFMQLLVPILVDVYAASVITPVRIKTLTGLLKAVSFLDADGLKPVLMVRPILGTVHYIYLI